MELQTFIESHKETIISSLEDNKKWYDVWDDEYQNIDKCIVDLKKIEQ